MADTISFDTVRLNLDRALASIDADPEDAITAACSTIESVCRSILIELGQPQSSRPTNGVLADAEQPGEFCDAAPVVVAQTADLGALLGRESKGPTTDSAAATGGGETFAGPLCDALALKLGDRGEDVEYQPASRRGGVNVLGQAAEACTGRLDAGDDPEQVLKRPAETIILGDHYHVARTQLVNQTLEFGPGGAVLEIFSAKTRPAPAASRAVSWASRCWSSVETRA